MEAASEGTRGAAIRAPLDGWLAQSGGWFVGGSLGSAMGFALPWFRVSRSYEWWYGGWGLLTTNAPGLGWIGIIFLGYAVLVLGGFFLLRADIAGASLSAALAIAVALGTLVVVALAAADAVNGLGRVYGVDLNIGLFLMLPGHGVMIVAAFVALVVHVVRRAASGEPVPARDSA